MISNIVFDVGKVLVSYEPEKMMKSLGFNQAQIEAVNQAVFRNPLWLEGDRGSYPPKEMHRRFLLNDPDYQDEIQLVYDHLGETIQLMPHTMSWVKGLKERNLHLYVLSNYSEELYLQSKEKMLFLPFMDDVIFSYRVNMVKPQKEIYQILLSKFSLTASETVFIDDRLENIAGAQQNGIHGILFQTPEQAMADLEQLLSKHF